MEAKEFVDKLKYLAPSMDSMLKRGCSQETAQYIVGTHLAKTRRNPLLMETFNDQMLELVKHWDLSGVEVGPLCFHGEPIAYGDDIEVGTIDLDQLVYCTSTRDYALFDHEVDRRLMCAAAPNGAFLLQGLAEVASYYAKTGNLEIDIDDTEIGLQFKSRVVAAIGGAPYATFVTALLGV
jgi:hypothetical protein